MKKAVLILATAFAILLFCSFTTSQKRSNLKANNDATTDAMVEKTVSGANTAVQAGEKVGADKLREYLNIEEKDIKFETSDLDKLKKRNDEFYGIYNFIIGFLEGNSGFMKASMSEMPEGRDAYIEYGIPSVVVDEFDLIEYPDKENTNYNKAAVYFNVSESNSEQMPKGRYYYSVDSLSWKNLEAYKPDEKYDDAISIVRTMADYGAFSWKDGKGAAEHDQFSFAVYRTIAGYFYKKEIHVTDENLKNTAKAMFGIENYTPELYVDSKKIERFELKDGVWKEKWEPGDVNIGPSMAYFYVTDLRQSDDGTLEIDLQYYADAYMLVPSHKVTVYASLQENDFCRYLFKEAKITEYSEYEPYRYVS